MTDKVVLGFLSPGTLDSLFADSVMRVLLVDANRPVGERRIVENRRAYIHTISGPRIAAARNETVRRFLEDEEGDWLWMLDSDMTFSPEILDLMLEVADPVERPVIGGLCFGGGKGVIFPTMYQLVDPATNNGVAVRTVLDWPEHGVVEVDATGAACLLMHRSVLEQLLAANPDSPTPWFHESVYKGQEFGEDWTFCLKVRSLGHRIYVNTDAATGHRKTYELNEELWRTGKVALDFVGGPPAARIKPVEQLNRQQRRELIRKAS